VGLTGVGKSTIASLLLRSRPQLQPLPNRRELANRVVLPDAQRLSGETVRPVNDRLERFRLTAVYRRAHPGGMAHALERYLAKQPPGIEELLFDNLRGVEEVGYAVQAFPRARLLLLTADPVSRVLRLVKRNDPFDAAATTSTDGSSRLSLTQLEGAAAVFGPSGLADLTASSAGISEEAVLRAARIVIEEQRNYDNAAAAALLTAARDPRDYLVIDTSRLEPSGIIARLTAWL